MDLAIYLERIWQSYWNGSCNLSGADLTIYLEQTLAIYLERIWQAIWNRTGNLIGMDTNFAFNVKNTYVKGVFSIPVVLYTRIHILKLTK